MSFTWIELGEPVLKILLAIGLSGVIGYEREISDKPAGLRTNILIGLGSTVMMMISIHVATLYSSGLSDPSRIAAQVVTGIGFLGAGTIMQARGAVKGLTTAASMWAVAGIGLAVGSGMYFLAVLTTVAILAVLWFLGRAQHRLMGKALSECVRVQVADAAEFLRALNEVHANTAIKVKTLNVRQAAGGYSVEFRFHGTDRDRGRVHELLRQAPGLQSIDLVPDDDVL